MTVANDFNDLIGRIEDNLNDMGVSDAEFNAETGLMGLVDKILDIEPSVAGLDLDTHITCSCENIGNVGVPLIITGILSASYDDSTVADVDLSGVLQNATVVISDDNGDTIVGTAVTDNNGRYTFEYIPSETGVLNIVAAFYGTENYDSCHSSIVTVDIYSLIVTSSSDIVSDGETVTLTATYLDETNTPIENETITFEITDKNGEEIDTLTAVTDSSGLATVSYLGKHAGDLYIKSICGSLQSEVYNIHDYAYIVDNDSKLVTAFSNATSGDTIYLLNGTYTISQNFTINGITILGEDGAKITGKGNIIPYDCIIDNIILQRPDNTNFSIQIPENAGHNIIRNVEAISNTQSWDAQLIAMDGNNQNGLTEIYNCYLHGNAISTGYGHSCASIICHGATIYNVLIHHNTFNHPANSSVLHGGNKGKAVCAMNGNNVSSTLRNVHLYCNQYLGAGDTNIKVVEEQCPD